MSDTIVKNRLRKPIDSLTINKDDLLKFLQILQERANSACEIECNHIESFIKVEDLEKSKENLRSCSALKLTITGMDGEELFGSITEVFESLSFPEQIKSLYLNSELIYKSNFNYIPRNRFDIFIDFRKPKVLDFSFAPSEKTPNDSTFCVEGFDSTWVNGVFSEIDKFFNKRSSSISGIHKNSIYDVIVWILGIPIGFWACYKLSINISQVFSDSFLQNALFVYIFFLSLFILRILFHYFRWLYPQVQYKSTNDLSIIHRGFFYVIATSIIGAFLYDMLHLLF
ncbi:hypothetical protein [Labilibaculum manganireducens]|uniref:hypothetical protein n=1 Tax=Labilibaculum manganireducens TaxID=1940525 RepID=UPI0029F45FBE|nr:hypothetical protein [Labilibaculum manganireducens]